MVFLNRCFATLYDMKSKLVDIFEEKEDKQYSTSAGKNHFGGKTNFDGDNQNILTL